MANGNTNLMGTQFSAPSVDPFGFPISQPEWQDPYGTQAYNQEFNPIDPSAFAPSNPDLIRLSARNVDPFDPTQTYPDATGSGNISMYQSPQEQRGRMSEASIMGIVGGIGGIAQGLIGRRRRRKEQRKAGQEYREMRKQFEGLDTGNIYADVRNQYAGMENTFEDLTVNQQQAEFQRQMFAEQQASTLQGLRGAAGGSGIGALAQSLYNQGELSSQKAGAMVGQQERANQMAAAQQAATIQSQQAQGKQWSINKQQEAITGQLSSARADKAVADAGANAARTAQMQGWGEIVGGVAGGVQAGQSNQQAGGTFWNANA